VTYCVNAAVEAMELFSTHAKSDPFGPKPCVFKLTSRSYSMLPRRDRSHPRIDRVAFCVHMDL